MSLSAGATQPLEFPAPQTSTTHEQGGYSLTDDDNNKIALRNACGDTMKDEPAVTSESENREENVSPKLLAAPIKLKLADRIKKKNVDASAILSAPDFVSIVWATLTNDSEAVPIPPTPFSRRSWPHFCALLCVDAKNELLALIEGANVDSSASISFLASSLGRKLTSAGALLPIRNTLGAFLVYRSPSVIRVFRELEPLLRQMPGNSEHRSELEIRELELGHGWCRTRPNARTYNRTTDGQGS
jgi:hypothetical protein